MEAPSFSPEPDDAERQAIVEALTAEKAEQAEEAPASAWADSLLPERGGEEPEP